MKKKVKAAGILSVLLAVSFLITGFGGKTSICEELLKERTDIISMLSYGEITGLQAEKMLCEIETGSLLLQDVSYVYNMNSTEICIPTDMYISEIAMKGKGAEYQIYEAIIEWKYNDNIYESIRYHVVLKHVGNDYKLSKISVLP